MSSAVFCGSLRNHLCKMQQNGTRWEKYADICQQKYLFLSFYITFAVQKDKGEISHFSQSIQAYF